jgi:hypothetical protein
MVTTSAVNISFLSYTAAGMYGAREVVERTGMKLPGGSLAELRNSSNICFGPD